MARTKGETYTQTIEHELLEPYYLSYDKTQFSVHKRIKSGHQLPAKSYHSSIGRAVEKSIEYKVADKMMQDEVETLDLITFVNKQAEKTKELVEGLKDLLNPNFLSKSE